MPLLHPAQQSQDNAPLQQQGSRGRAVNAMSQLNQMGNEFTLAFE
jgi:hypothetical protein